MAYTIPVAALVLDHGPAAAAINEPANYFDDDRNDRWDGVEALAKVTGAPITAFSSEDGSIFYIGIQIESDWCIEINFTLISKVGSLKAQYDHPLVQAAKLAVVSQFN